MAVKRCLKCGAEIPEEAQFCPSCGAPKGTEAIREEAMQPSSQPQPQQTPPPPQQQMYQYQQPQKSGDPLQDLAKTLFSRKMLIIAISLGLLFVFIGGTITTFTNDPTEPWEDRIVSRAGSTIQSLGIIGVSMMLISGGLVNTKFDKYTRFGMILGGAIILAW